MFLGIASDLGCFWGFLLVILVIIIEDFHQISHKFLEARIAFYVFLEAFTDPESELPHDKANGK